MILNPNFGLAVALPLVTGGIDRVEERLLLVEVRPIHFIAESDDPAATASLPTNLEPHDFTHRFLQLTCDRTAIRPIDHHDARFAVRTCEFCAVSLRYTSRFLLRRKRAVFLDATPNDPGHIWPRPVNVDLLDHGFLLGQTLVACLLSPHCIPPIAVSTAILIHGAYPFWNHYSRL